MATPGCAMTDQTDSLAIVSMRPNKICKALEGHTERLNTARAKIPLPILREMAPRDKTMFGGNALRNRREVTSTNLWRIGRSHQHFFQVLLKGITYCITEPLILLHVERIAQQ